jgi:tripartite-type tricarboxylate transporter receptor subunit TctC
MRKQLIRILTIILAAGGSIANAQTQQWPSKPIRAIVPLSAGSAVDIIPRIVFEQLSTQLGQSIVIENRPGASGTIGSRAVLAADPDGYTLLAHSSAHTISPATVANMPYDAAKDFAAVGALGNLPMVLVVSPAKNIHTVQELVAAGKKQPLTFGSIGVGSPIHLALERFRISAGFQAQAIPFKGAPEALTETMTGRVDMYYAPVLAALPFIRDGKLVPLAVSSAKRASSLPDVPTTLEAGYANSDYDFWIGVFAPAKTPHDIIEKLNANILKALQTSVVREKFAKLGVEPMLMNTAQFDTYIKAQFATNAALAKAAGIQAQ